jgi:hypothetical protein
MNTLLITILASKPKKGNGAMSKQKNKKHKTATPKEPVTRRDLCERIRNLLIEINALRNTNAMLADSTDFLRNTSQRSLKLVDESIDKLERMKKCVRHYRTMASIAVLALILSGICHLINIFF